MVMIERLLREELKRQNYLNQLVDRYGDEQIAKFYLDSYSDSLNELNEHGGEVFRLAFTNNHKATEEAPGTNWTMTKDTLKKFLHNGPMVIVKGYVRPGSVDMEKSIDKYTSNPQQDELVLVATPEIKMTKRLK